jgi:Peptidase propeptide and YPEB domain
MNEFYALLIVGVSTSALVVFILLLHDSSTDIQSVTRNIENGKSVYEIEIVKNDNQYFDVIVDPSVGNVTKINDTL